MGSVLFCRTDRNQADLLTTQFDLKVVARLQVEHGGICLADHQVAVELNLCRVGKLPTTLPDFFATTTAKVTSLGI